MPAATILMEQSVGAFAVSSFASVFVAVDPFAVVPLFLVMTEGSSSHERVVTARKAALATFTVLTVFALLGPALLSALGITLVAFRIAGGVLLFLLAIDMLRAQPSRARSSPEEEDEGARSSDVSIFPLTIPMLAGPGATSTVMVLATKAGTFSTLATLGAVVAVVAALSFLILRSATWIGVRLGKTGMNVVERVLGLVLAATAVQFVLDGLSLSVIHHGSR